jgi:ribosomal-protein-alanine N-acetyltransferase
MTQPTLTTTRATLVPAALEDLEALWVMWRHSDVRRYLFDEQLVPRERAAEVLDGCLAARANGIGLWTIRAHGSSDIIGCVGLMPVTWTEYDPSGAGLLEPIVALTPASWHQGHAVAALRTLVAYAFGPLDLMRLAGATDVPNEASHRMLTRAGFVPQRECPGPHYRIRTYLLERAHRPLS